MRGRSAPRMVCLTVAPLLVAATAAYGQPWKFGVALLGFLGRRALLGPASAVRGGQAKA